MTAVHEFGGQHTEIKLAIVESYLKAYTTALRNKFRDLWYIDAFAGTGKRTTRTIFRGGEILDERPIEIIDQRRGSAQIAIDIRPKFDRLVFIEKNPAYCVELRRLQQQHQDRDIVVVEGDANQSIQTEIAWDGWQSARGVCFLDPYGMEVEWATLEAIAKTRSIDVWFLFPLSGLYRQATRSFANIDASKRAALTRMFGSEQWINELYHGRLTNDLFGSTFEIVRSEDVAGLERYVQSRLATIFPKVLKPLALPIGKKPQRFSLFLCISNDDPKAIALATRIGNYILKAGISS